MPRKSSSSSEVAVESKDTDLSFDATSADELQLPPEGFILYVLVRRTKDLIKENDARELIREYIAQKGDNREGSRAVKDMSQFLGRIISTAESLSPEVRT